MQFQHISTVQNPKPPLHLRESLPVFVSSPSAPRVETHLRVLFFSLLKFTSRASPASRSSVLLRGKPAPSVCVSSRLAQRALSGTPWDCDLISRATADLDNEARNALVLQPIRLLLIHPCEKYRDPSTSSFLPCRRPVWGRPRCLTRSQCMCLLDGIRLRPSHPIL